MSNRYGAREAVRHFGLAWIAGIALAIAAMVMSASKDLPIREPDGVLPSYITFPGVLALAILIDVLPRMVHRARVRRQWAPRELGAVAREVMAERLSLIHI